MEKYILSIDQGTTSTKAILFDKNGDAKYISQKPLDLIYPNSGWVEVNAKDIWVSVVNAITELFISNNISFKNIDSIGITNQRETTIIWDKATGEPVYNGIVWQSRQSADICDALSDKKDFIHKKTGLLINPYFSASKIRFILDKIPNGQARAENGELMFGTVDTWIIYRMTNKTIHATDVSNASRTMLMNINTLEWDKELCDLFNIPLCILPEIKPSSYRYGVVSAFGSKVEICGVAGDQQAALFGQNCFKEGDTKNTYGTGCFMLMNIGDKVKLSNNGLLTTVAWQIGDKVAYALEGSVFIGGAVIQWCRDQMKLLTYASESEDYAKACCNSKNKLFVVPAFVGLGTPYWDDQARGAVFGITRNTSREEFVKACLEGICYQCKDVFEIMKEEAKMPLNDLRVDGGSTANKYLLQFQADIMECDISLPKCLETTALGACYLAGLASGYFSSIQEIKNIHDIQAKYHNNMSKDKVDELYSYWKKAVEATRMFK